MDMEVIKTGLIESKLFSYEHYVPRREQCLAEDQYYIFTISLSLSQVLLPNETKEQLNLMNTGDQGKTRLEMIMSPWYKQMRIRMDNA